MKKKERGGADGIWERIIVGNFPNGKGNKHQNPGGTENPHENQQD